MLDVRCPGCAKLLQVAEPATDRESACPACGLVFRPHVVRGDPAQGAPTGIMERLANPTISRDPPARYDVVEPLTHLDAGPSRFAKIGLTVGALTVVCNGLWHAEASLYDYAVIAYLILGSAVLLSVAYGLTVAYGLILHLAPNSWFRRNFSTTAVGALCLFGLLCLVMVAINRRPIELAVIVAIWVCASVGLGMYWIALGSAESAQGPSEPGSAAMPSECSQRYSARDTHTDDEGISC